MEITAASVVPALATLAAAFVAGGIARSNLIVSKEAKISEFRQAWVGELRENLSTLFSAVRLLARAVQEARTKQNGNETDSKFRFSQEKIEEVRHSSAELRYRIGLLLDNREESHSELQRLLDVMLTTLQAYITGGTDADIDMVFDALERANKLGTVVVAQEWEMVRLGEPEYRNAVRGANSVLLVAGVLMLALTAVAFFTPATGNTKAGLSMQPISPASQAVSSASNPTPISKPPNKMNDQDSDLNTSVSVSHTNKRGNEMPRDAVTTTMASASTDKPKESSSSKK